MISTPRAGVLALTALALTATPALAAPVARGTTTNDVMILDAAGTVVSTASGDKLSVADRILNALD